MKLRQSFLLSSVFLALTAGNARALEVKSPNGQVVLSFDVKDFDGARSCAVYGITYKGRPVITTSQMALEIEGSLLKENLQIIKQAERSHDEQWKPLYGERSAYRDHYNQVVVDLKESAAPGRLFSVTLRAYDEGAAFAYTLPKQPGLEKVTIASEDTEFRMTADHNVWRSFTAQGVHSRVPISQMMTNLGGRGGGRGRGRGPAATNVAASEPAGTASSASAPSAIGRVGGYGGRGTGPAGTMGRALDGRSDPGVERPLTVEVAPDIVAAIAEARQVNYPRMKLMPLTGKPNSLVSKIAVPAIESLPLTMPWRVVMLADSPGQLLEQNYLLLNLNEPSAIADTSWIKPGKVIRETSLSTRGAKGLIDFASKYNIQYILFDAGWYGPESAPSSDPRKVAVNPDRPQGGLDLQEVIQYGNEHNVGVILYVNRLALRRDLDDIIPLYKGWGVRGIKFGFIDVGSQDAIEWLYGAIRKCADTKLMVDAHDEFRPTGWNRTLPNFVTQEGIGGDETSPTNTTTLANLFTRMLAGAADNTHCYFDPRIDSGLPATSASAPAGGRGPAPGRMGTHAYQLGKVVCMYSPFQHLFWYDRAAAVSQATGAGGVTPGNNVLIDVPEMEFFAALPTVWDDTKVLRGEIGEDAVIARRSGPDWFVGVMNANTPRDLEVPLGFLDQDRTYVASIYTDDPTVDTRTRVKIERFSVTKSTTLKFPVSAKGGVAIRLAPAAATDNYPRYPAGR